MPLIVIDKKTGVIKKMTTDPSIMLDSTESLVDFPDAVDLTKGFIKISGGKIVAATDQDATLAGINYLAIESDRELKINDIQALISDMASKGVDFVKLQLYFQMLSDYYQLTGAIKI